MSERKTIAKAVAVTAELMGQQVSKDALRQFVEDLAEYPEVEVLRALDDCRKHGTRLIPSAVILRLESSDGRPGPEEAWSLMPHGEEETTVWTTEMCAAYLVVADNPDRVSARMAFLEKYKSEVAVARAAKRPVAWFVSLGHDPQRRTSAILAAVEKGRLTADEARGYLGGEVESPKQIGGVQEPALMSEIIDATLADALNGRR